MVTKEHMNMEGYEMLKKMMTLTAALALFASMQTPVSAEQVSVSASVATPTVAPAAKPSTSSSSDKSDDQGGDSFDCTTCNAAAASDSTKTNDFFRSCGDQCTGPQLLPLAQGLWVAKGCKSLKGKKITQVCKMAGKMLTKGAYSLLQLSKAGDTDAKAAVDAFTKLAAVDTGTDDNLPPDLDCSTCTAAVAGTANAETLRNCAHCYGSKVYGLSSAVFEAQKCSATKGKLSEKCKFAGEMLTNAILSVFHLAKKGEGDEKTLSQTIIDKFTALAKKPAAAQD
jgi:hypothetical protein